MHRANTQYTLTIMITHYVKILMYILAITDASSNLVAPYNVDTIEHILFELNKISLKCGVKFDFFCFLQGVTTTTSGSRPRSPPSFPYRATSPYTRATRHT